MINWKEFNWPEIFGTIYAVAPLMIQNQFRFLAADIQETATAKYSNGQLKYIGNEANGKDYFFISEEEFKNLINNKVSLHNNFLQLHINKLTFLSAT